MIRYLFLCLLLSSFHQACHAQNDGGYRAKNLEVLLRGKIIGFPFMNYNYAVLNLSAGAELRIRERFGVMGEYVFYNWDFRDTYISFDGQEYEAFQHRFQYYTAMEYRFYPMRLNLPNENESIRDYMYWAVNHKFGKRAIRTDSNYDLDKNDISTLNATFNEFNLLLGYQTKGRLGLDISSGLGWRIEEQLVYKYQGQQLPDKGSYEVKNRPSLVVRWSIFYNLTKDE
jgi:hypothetical protein